jgi:hypothetical protein
MWKWVAAAALALVVGFALGRATNMHRGNYGYWPPCHNEFGQMHNNRGMGPQCMGGSFNGGPMMGNCRNCPPMEMRGPGPGNNMPGNCGPNKEGGNRMNFMPWPPPPENDMPGRCGCCNRPGNDGNTDDRTYGHNKKGGDKMERRHKCDKDDEDDD